MWFSALQLFLLFPDVVNSSSKMAFTPFWHISTVRFQTPNPHCHWQCPKMAQSFQSRLFQFTGFPPIPACFLYNWQGILVFSASQKVATEALDSQLPLTILSTTRETAMHQCDISNRPFFPPMKQSSSVVWLCPHLHPLVFDSIPAFQYSKSWVHLINPPDPDVLQWSTGGL